MQLADEAEYRVSYSVESVARLTEFGVRTIYEAINSGQLKAKKFGRKTVVLRDALMSFLNGLPDYEPELVPVVPVEPGPKKRGRPRKLPLAHKV